MKPNIKFGIILGGALMFISLLFYALGMDKNETVSKIAGIFNIILPAIITFLGIKALRDENQNGFITFGQGFSCGMVISIVGAAISGIYSYLYFVVINPGMVTYVRMKQEEEMLSRGLSESEVEKMSGTMEMWTTPGMMAAFAVIGMIVLGLVISLIAAAILKKEDPSANIS